MLAERTPLGSQQPRLCHVPEYVSSAGVEVIECAAVAGLHLDPWEQSVLVGGCGERANGKWSAFEVGIEAPRQNGKGSIFEARELAGLFVFGEKLLIHSAHEQLTSSEHFRRVLDLIEGVPEFEQRVLKVVRGKGSEAIELRKGQRIFFKTRTGGGGRGLTGDFVGLDEAMFLPIATTAALVPTMAARSITGNPQLWYAGSAVDQLTHEHGIVFTRLRERAMAGAARVAYFGFSAGVREWLEARGLPFDESQPEIDQVTPEMRADPAMWAQANPGMGIRISSEHISDECAGALGPREFAVERLGIGDPPDTSEDTERVISAEAFKLCGCDDEAQRIETHRAFAVDLNPSRTWGSIGVSGVREDGLLHVAVVEHKRGAGWIISQDEDGEWQGRAVELHEEYPDAPFIMDSRGPAANLIQPLKDAGIEVIETSTREYANACGGFYDAVDQVRVKYPVPQPFLDEALASARATSLGDAWKWAPRSSTSADITALIACTLALWGAENAPETESMPLIAWR